MQICASICHALGVIYVMHVCTSSDEMDVMQWLHSMHVICMFTCVYAMYEIMYKCDAI